MAKHIEEDGGKGKRHVGTHGIVPMASRAGKDHNLIHFRSLIMNGEKNLKSIYSLMWGHLEYAVGTMFTRE